MLFTICLTGQQYYIEYDEISHSIYNDIISLKLENARYKLSLIDKTKTRNLSYIHLENYLDFFDLFVSENEMLFDQLKRNKKRRINLLESLLPDSDPYKNFVIAEIHLQWALTRSKFGELFKSGREIYKAYKLLNGNMELHPGFLYNNKSLSIIHALIETVSIPGFIKSLFGIEGSIHQGLEEIESLYTHCLKEEDIFEPEVEAIFIYILFYQGNQKEQAIDLMNVSFQNHLDSPLVCFIKSKLLQRSGKNQDALDILASRSSDPNYSDFYYLDYLEGLGLLRKLDPSCMDYFTKFVSSFNGRHFIKEAYQKLAWASLLFDNDTEGYYYYMSQVRKEGAKLTDDDKQAFRESLSKHLPHQTLLKARLLFDGGYYDRALSVLGKNKVFARNPELKTEYFYRLARINQALRNHDEAITQFTVLLDEGDKGSYFVCNAALQAGLISEQLDNLEEAELYFKTCLKLNSDEYENSLHQKARSGINRITIK